jgi:hypothetical protein
MEELYWKQRAKCNWFQHGDRNTKFFNVWATQRKRRNHIERIHDEAGREWTKQEDIGIVFTDYFQGLFSSDGPVGIDECLSILTPRVTGDMNDSLTRPFLPEEVDNALRQMQPLKAPGPDGFGACFFQHNWAMVGPDIRKYALDFLNLGIFNPALNSTHIALIPKLPNAVSVSDFCPISLCNVVYKIFAKVLANKLKVVLPAIILPQQSAFVPGHLITDNILVAYEALHTMKTRMRGKKGYMSIKIDISKAYDRVEWAFLEGIMRRMGFDEVWIARVMVCVSTVSYSILINGNPTGVITPSRGIRQGDPLSPYLFLLCAEGLSALLSHVDHHSQISGVPISPRGYKLSHLFFANDILLFCRATFLEWCQIFKLLQVYEKASSQKLNGAKIAIFFSKNVGSAFKSHIQSLTGVTATKGYEKYLGLPALVGRSKMKAFTDIQGRVQRHLEGWKERFLSQAGKRF